MRVLLEGTHTSVVLSTPFRLVFLPGDLGPNLTLPTPCGKKSVKFTQGLITLTLFQNILGNEESLTKPVALTSIHSVAQVYIMTC